MFACVSVDSCKTLTDAHSLYVQHYLDYECLILGGYLMANLTHIHHGRCHISFVKRMAKATATTSQASGYTK